MFEVAYVFTDGSGPGVISQLVILDGIMTRIAYGTHIDDTELLPAHYFDFMGGVGFGGCVSMYFSILYTDYNGLVLPLFY